MSRGEGVPGLPHPQAGACGLGDLGNCLRTCINPSPHSGGNRAMRNWTLRWVLASPVPITCAQAFQQAGRGWGGGPCPDGEASPQEPPLGGGGAGQPLSRLRTAAPPPPAENHAHPEAAPGHVPGPEPEVAARRREGQGCAAGPGQQGLEGGAEGGEGVGGRVSGAEPGRGCGTALR